MQSAKRVDLSLTFVRELEIIRRALNFQYLYGIAKLLLFLNVSIFLILCNTLQINI